MRIRVSYIASIPDEELLAGGIALHDRDAIMEYFFEQGGEEAFHDHGDGFEILD